MMRGFRFSYDEPQLTVGGDVAVRRNCGGRFLFGALRFGGRPEKKWSQPTFVHVLFGRRLAVGLNTLP